MSKQAIIYKKGSNEKVLENFKSSEFDCPCKWEDCKITFITRQTLMSLYLVRDDFDCPVRIESGTRCVRRNDLVGGAPNSSHLFGDGLDLIALNGDTEGLAEICRKHFKYVKVYDDGHIHVDNRFNLDLI
jgi:hypothetical protein